MIGRTNNGGKGVSVDSISAITGFASGVAFNQTFQNAVLGTLVHIAASRLNDTTAPITCNVSGAEKLKEKKFYASNASCYDGWYKVTNSTVGIYVAHPYPGAQVTFVN